MTESADVTIVTYRDFPTLYPDDVLLAGALRENGASVRVAVWDDATVDWSASPRTVLRSTWDYFERPQAFRAWVDAADARTQLINSARTIRWNMEKSYLLELQDRGFDCVPTALIRAGEPFDVSALSRQRGWHDVVIKPAISGASFGTKRFADLASPDAQAHANAHLAAARDVLIQPYLHAIEETGEIAMMFVEAQYSHAVRKLPFHAIPEDGVDPERVVRPGDDLIGLARRILETLEETPVYARVDFVVSEGVPLLMELELIEPSFYFRVEAESAQRLARAILASEPLPSSNARRY